MLLDELSALAIPAGLSSLEEEEEKGDAIEDGGVDDPVPCQVVSAPHGYSRIVMVLEDGREVILPPPPAPKIVSIPSSTIACVADELNCTTPGSRQPCVVQFSVFRAALWS